MKMKKTFVLITLAFLANCALHKDRWVTSTFSASQINSVVLNTNLGTEEYSLFLCSKPNSVGELRLSNNSSRFFCVSKAGEVKFATIRKSESNTKICLWKEHGFCADGVCESISSASDCKTL
ncbi:hypothetical protein GCM10011613_24050 [Cellvibrio zantedeschiae]|uniref:Lipoprotein n=1 Tax=Cellvibrio zantedeschiae TaxID=1237077 RepID=A0ABQ3B503_9GAMM|nr:hypothetical protein [Cellvibrio zantedeschiae]GGY78554.1 hypothetical protein GCM10011613_24050 [Cellvibrio zantedeschiae]